ncbi:hypothetical protein BH10PSE13_BH10PSE13_22150 [soil metagenome]
MNSLFLGLAALFLPAVTHAAPADGVTICDAAWHVNQHHAAKGTGPIASNSTACSAANGPARIGMDRSPCRHQ